MSPNDYYPGRLNFPFAVSLIVLLYFFRSMFGTLLLKSSLLVDVSNVVMNLGDIINSTIFR